jgi:hypothetical protein
MYTRLQRLARTRSDYEYYIKDYCMKMQLFFLLQLCDVMIELLLLFIIICSNTNLKGVSKGLVISKMVINTSKHARLLVHYSQY